MAYRIWAKYSFGDNSAGESSLFMLGLNPQWVAGPTEVEVDLKVNSTTSVQCDWFIQQHQNLILPRLSPTHKHTP